jgi:hypothetical protein
MLVVFCLYKDTSFANRIISEYELKRISVILTPTPFWLEDVTKYYSERAARDMPRKRNKNYKKETRNAS